MARCDEGQIQLLSKTLKPVKDFCPKFILFKI